MERTKPNIPMSKPSILISLSAMLFATSWAAHPPQLKRADSTRVLTYNIQHGRGMDDKVDLERIARVLRDIDADYIALQELDWFTKRNPGMATISNLAVLVDMHYVFGPAIDYGGGKYGVGIMSNEPAASDHRPVYADILITR